MHRFFTPNKFRFLVILTLVLLVPVTALGILSCGAKTQAPPSFSQDQQAQFDQIVSDVMAKYGIPGAIVGLWIPGQGEWVVARGVGDLATGAAPDITDKMRMGSITKTVTATVVLQLADEGKLGLDDALSKYEPWVPNSGNITIRELLNMTSGLYNYTNDGAFWDQLLANPLTAWPPRQIVDLALTHPPDFAPGTEYEYSNTNYILLGMVIEQVTGNSADQEIQTRIIDRLGLKNTSFPEVPEMPSPHMEGYMSGADNTVTDLNQLEDITVLTPTGYWTAGAMITTVDDLKVWVQALAQGTLLSPAMQQQRLTFVPAGNPTYGLGIMPITGTPFLGHSGEVLGFNSSAYTDPTTGNTVVVLINRYPAAIEGVSDGIAIKLLEAAGLITLPQ